MCGILWNVVFWGIFLLFLYMTAIALSNWPYAELWYWKWGGFAVAMVCCMDYFSLVFERYFGNSVRLDESLEIPSWGRWLFYVIIPPVFIIFSGVLAPGLSFLGVLVCILYVLPSLPLHRFTSRFHLDSSQIQRMMWLPSLLVMWGLVYLLRLNHDSNHFFGRYERAFMSAVTLLPVFFVVLTRGRSEICERGRLLRFIGEGMSLGSILLFPFVNSSISLLLIVLFFLSHVAAARRKVRMYATGVLLGAICLCAIVLHVERVRLIPYREYSVSLNRADCHSDVVNLFHAHSGSRPRDFYIAHGGGTGKYEYANTAEAVNDSLRKGFRFIELDLLETTDGHIVAAHDWKLLRSMMKGGVEESQVPMSSVELQGQTTADGQHLLMEKEICRLLELNKDMILVTDKIANHELLMKLIPYPERMITEVFSPEGYLSALRAGILYPACCVGNSRELAIADEIGIPMVTMPDNRLLTNVFSILNLQRLHRKGKTMLVFSSADKLSDGRFLDHHLGKSFSKIYTGKWSPLNPHLK